MKTQHKHKNATTTAAEKTAKIEFSAKILCLAFKRARSSTEMQEKEKMIQTNESHTGNYSCSVACVSRFYKVLKNEAKKLMKSKKSRKIVIKL